VERTAAELGALDVPLLRDVLARYPRIPLIIELKEATPALAEGVVAEVRRAQAEWRVCLGSFSVPALRRVRAAAPEIATSAGRFEVRMALYRSWFRCSPGRVPYRAFQVPETSGRTRVVSPRFVQMAHRAGLAVQVWTVDEPADIHRLLGWGVDAIITARPDIAAEIMRSRRSAVGRPQ